ncbi:MAG: CHAT domain-containing tetratricopeptide repeat protein [Terriglobia bacterium]
MENSKLALISKTELRQHVPKQFRCLLLLLVTLVGSRLPLCGQNQAPKELLHEADRLAWLNNWAKAGPLYEQAENLFNKAGDVKNTHYARIGNIHATFQSHNLPNLSRYLATEMENAVIQNDARLKLRWLVTKAEVDTEIDPPAARHGWEEVRSLAVQLGDKAWEARARGKLGYLAFFQGDIYQTQELLREALYSAESLGDLGAQIWYATTVGNGLSELGVYDQALKFQDEAIRLAESDKDAGFPYIAYAGKARSLAELKSRAEATRMLERGLREVRSLKRHLDEAYHLILLAKISATENNLPLAIAYLESTRSLCVEGGFHHTLAWSMFELAKVYRDSGNLQKAEDRAALAMNAMRQVQDQYHLPQHLALLAELAAKRGRFREADEKLEQAADVTESMLAHVPSTFSKTSLIATMSAIYVGHFVLAAEYLKDKPRAFEILEQARGRAAADIIRNHSLNPPNPDERTASLEKEINQIQARLQFEKTNNKSDRESFLDQLWRAKEKLNSIPEPRNRFQELTIHSKPVDLEDLRSILKPDEALLEYVLSEPTSYCIVVTRKNFDILSLTGRRKLEALVDGYLLDIRSKRISTDKAKQLYMTLLRPALGNPAQVKRLTVIPDGKLHLLPWESLVDSKGQYVLQSHLVSIAPSATVYYLLNTIQKPQEAQLPFLGVGGVPYGQEDSSAEKRMSTVSPLRGLSDQDLSRLTPLPSSKEEIEAAARIAGEKSVLLIGQDATKAGLLSKDLARFNILHFAVHAISDTTFPDRSSLVLWKDPSSDTDGLLQERDIRYLNLNAGLVVLSACDTSAGRLQGQEGMVSLVRAFFYAGARTVVASLWEAGDMGTSALMKRFYSHLMDGEDKAEALRHAKLDLLGKYGDDSVPFHWAGFVTVGEGNAPLFPGT